MAENKESKNRLENIMQLDTASLLQELKKLEHSLTEYQRQDAVPGWASSILPRIEFLEKTGGTSSLRSGGGADDENFGDMDAEDILQEKIKHIVDNRTKALQLAFDAKSSAAALEIDRLHKLLYIRPTTSELQQVVYSVQQVNKKADNVINEVGEGIQGIVAEKLADEMTSLMDRLKAAEEHGDRAVEVVTVRVDDIESELRKVRQGVKTELEHKENTIDAVKSEASALQESVAAMKSGLSALDEETKASLSELAQAQETSNEAFADFESSTNERVEILEENITACDEMIREEVSRADERHEEVVGSIAALTESFEAFKTSYETDMSVMRASQEAISELLNTTVERQTTIMNFMDSLKQFEVTAKITKNADSIDAMRRESELLEEGINGVRLSVVEVKKELETTNEELSDVPNKINVETLKIEANRKEIVQVKESLKYTKTMMQDQQNQLEDLSLLKEQMVMVKDVCETQDDRIKKVLRNIQDVSENLEAQDRRIDDVMQGMEVSEEKVLAKLSATKRAIDETISNQHADIEAKVQVLKDNVAICMAGAGGASKKGTAIATPKSTKSMTKQESAERVLSMVDSFDESRPPSAPQSAVLNHTSEKIEIVADMCSNFEEISHLRNAVPTMLPSAMCSDVASICQQIAAVLAETADLEVIQKSIKGDPASISYEDPVTDRREGLVNEVMVELRNKLVELDPNAGVTKLDARDLFMSRFYTALQLALSRHDQIIATGSSRLGRLKIPSCIACDRPLVSKVGRDSISSAAGGNRLKTPVSNGIGGGGSWSSQTAPYTTGGGNQPIGASMSTAAGHNLSRASSFGNDMPGPGGYLEHSIVDDGAGGNWRGGSSSKAVRLPSAMDDREAEANRKMMSKSQDFVLRAGFKMPKPGQYQPPASAEGRVQLPHMPPPH